MALSKQQKVELITTFVDRVRDYAISKVDAMPEEWDGVDLRIYLVHQFQWESQTSSSRNYSKRLRAVLNEIATRPI